MREFVYCAVGFNGEVLEILFKGDGEMDGHCLMIGGETYSVNDFAGWKELSSAMRGALVGYEECDAERESADDAAFEYFYEQVGPQWAQDHAEEIFKDNYDGAIKEFAIERLRSYYLTNPALAKPAWQALEYARSLMPQHHRAALVFAMTSTELAIKTVLLRPIVSGLVHSEYLAEFVCEISIDKRAIHTFNKLLTQILAVYGGIDLKTYKRSGSKLTINQELANLKDLRNAVVHGGAECDLASTELAVAIASCLSEEICPAVLRSFRLHIDEHRNICGEIHASQ